MIKKCGCKNHCTSSPARLSEISKLMEGINKVNIRGVDEIVVIRVPLLFHIMTCVGMSVDEARAHILTNILPAINADFNRSQANYSQYIHNAFMVNIFKNYPTKKNLYVYQYFNILKNNEHVKWEFTLKDVVMVIQSGKFDGTAPTDNPIIALSPALDPGSCVNIWVNRFTCSSGLTGASSFPWEDRLEDMSFDPVGIDYHGVEINSDAFNHPSHLYRTFSHGIGHYFGLFHVFDNIDITDEMYNFLGLDYDVNAPDDGEDIIGDLIVDTPSQIASTSALVNQSNAGLNLHFSTMFNNTNSYVPMFTNIMDYTRDDQMFYLTYDQHYKMIYFIKCFHPQMIPQHLN